MTKRVGARGSRAGSAGRGVETSTGVTTAGTAFYLLAGAALIIVAVAIAYSPSVGGGFVLDDDKLLTDNKLIRAADGLYKFWFTTEPYDYWPVSNTMLWIEWRLWGMHSTGYHITNLLLHVAEVLLIWRILSALAIPGAYLAAVLFALHPVNVESVAWIAQRKSLLAMLFFLVSILWYLKAEESASRSRASPPLADRWYWLSLTAFVAAMLSKVSAAVLPAVLLGIISWKRLPTKRDLMRVAPFFVVVAALLRVNLWFRTHGVEVPVSTATPLERVLGAAGAVWFYLYKAIWPFNLIFTYPEWHVRADQPWWWVALLAAIAVTAVLGWYRESWSRPLLFAWGYFCLSLVPVLGFTDVGFKQHIVVADHYQHAALIGVMAVVGALWSMWRERTPAPSRWLPNAAAIALGALLAVLTWQQSGLYANATTLYEDTLKKNPDAWMARTNLGAILSEAGRSQEAVAQLKRALQIKPDYPEAHNNLGNELGKAGDLQGAIAEYEEALRPNAHFPEAQNNLGDALVKVGRLQESVEHFEDALRFKPHLAEAQNNLCHVFAQLGRLPDAIERCQQALQLNPNFVEARYNLGNVLFQSNHMPEAIDSYERALRLKPDYAEAHNNLGTALAQVGRLQEAIEQYQQAVRLKPDFADAKNNLAVATTMKQNPVERDAR